MKIFLAASIFLQFAGYKSYPYNANKSLPAGIAQHDTSKARQHRWRSLTGATGWLQF
jgi:hypothetical protein